MNAFSLQMSLVDQGADITPMMKGWMDLSDGKGWPKNEEGWKRYLSRLTESGGFPKIRNKPRDKSFRFFIWSKCLKYSSPMRSASKFFTNFFEFNSSFNF